MKNLYLKLFLLTGLVSFFPFTGRAQQFTHQGEIITEANDGIIIKNGQLSGGVKSAIHFTTLPSKDTQDSAVVDASEQKDILEKELYTPLLKSLNKTLDSLDDDRTGLKAFYQAIPDAPYVSLRAELDKIKAYLADKNHALPADEAIKAIDKAIHDIVIQYYWAIHYDPLKSVLQVKVYRDDPLKLFLQAYLSGCGDPYSKQRADGTFYTDRMRLENDFEKILTLKLQRYTCLSCAANVGDPPDGMRELNESIENNPLYQDFLVQKACWFSLLWLSDGSVRTLAFSAATKYDWKNVFLYNKLVQQQIDSIKKCCAIEPAKIEALLKAANKGKSRFRAAGGFIAGYKDGGDIFKSRTYINLIQFPVIRTPDCCQPGYFEPYRRKWVINYDASQNYVTDQPCLKPAVPEDEQVIIAVNNVPAEKNVIISGTEVAITDQSKAQAALADVGSGLASAAGSILPFAGIIASNYPVASIPANTQISAQGFGETHPQAGPGGHFATDRSYFTLIKNGLKFEFPQPVNKLAYLYAYILGAPLESRSAMQEAAAYYLANCYSPMVDISSKGAARMSINALYDDFKKFLIYNAGRTASYNKLAQKIPLLNTLLSSLDDVLPPKPAAVSATDKPAYSTVLSTFDRVQAPKEKDYVITEEVLSPAKKASAAKADGAAADDSVKTNVMKGSFKVGKRYFVQVSAGLGITTNDFAENVPASSGNTIAVNEKDEQASFLVGLNFYLWKAFNLDNNILGIKNKRVLAGRWKNRLSVYTGVGIPDPLKNFYGGISDDILPGIKLTAGAHFLIYTKYQVTNNAVTDQASGFRYAGPFIAVCLDADFVGKLFSLFK